VFQSIRPQNPNFVPLDGFNVSKNKIKIKNVNNIELLKKKENNLNDYLFLVTTAPRFLFPFVVVIGAVVVVVVLALLSFRGGVQELKTEMAMVWDPVTYNGAVFVSQLSGPPGPKGPHRFALFRLRDEAGVVSALEHEPRCTSAGQMRPVSRTLSLVRPDGSTVEVSLTETCNMDPHEASLLGLRTYSLRSPVDPTLRGSMVLRDHSISVDYTSGDHRSGSVHPVSSYLLKPDHSLGSNLAGMYTAYWREDFQHPNVVNPPR
jgi:hypothetical protein